jgi:hypothetical protein
MAFILQYGKQERGDMKDLILKMVQRQTHSTKEVPNGRCSKKFYT